MEAILLVLLVFAVFIVCARCRYEPEVRCDLHQSVHDIADAFCRRKKGAR